MNSNRCSFRNYDGKCRAAWDNSKKWIEEGNLGGKGTATHAAPIVGDTVGDPLKDTTGPSMNILIKLMSVVALVFAPVFVNTRKKAVNLLKFVSDNHKFLK